MNVCSDNALYMNVRFW